MQTPQYLEVRAVEVRLSRWSAELRGLAAAAAPVRLHVAGSRRIISDNDDNLKRRQRNFRNRGRLVMKSKRNVSPAEVSIRIFGVPEGDAAGRPVVAASTSNSVRGCAPVR